MIKLTRGVCPDELSDEVVEELVSVYRADKEKDVWNSAKIKKPLKEALMQMSNDKCVYCECTLGVESKDVTIDHFKPKVTNADIVVDWDNLVPACLRCNRVKNRKEEKIINPCEIDPKLHLAISKSTKHRLKSLNGDVLGKHTINVVGLNDIDRIIAPRARIVDAKISELEELLDDIADHGLQKKYIARLERKLRVVDERCEYSAIVSANILNSDEYDELKRIISDEGKWNVRLMYIEDKMKELALELI